MNADDRFRWYINPGRRSTRARRTIRPRLRRSGTTVTLGTRSPFKGRVTRINPLTEVMMLGNPRRRRHRARRHSRNPGAALGRGPVGSVKDVMRHPGQQLVQAGVGVGSAALTIGLANQFLPFPGVTITDKVLRGVSRVAAGAVVVMLARQVAPRQASSAMAGASIAAVGSFVLDLVGLGLTLGAGDQMQTLASFMPILPTLPGGTPGVGAYARLRGLGAYSRAQLPSARGGSANLGMVQPMMALPGGRSRLGGSWR